MFSYNSWLYPRGRLSLGLQISRIFKNEHDRIVKLLKIILYRVFRTASTTLEYDFVLHDSWAATVESQPQDI